MLGKLVTKVGLGWLTRRIPDWGGIGGLIGGALLVVFKAFDKLDDETKQTIYLLLAGNWKEITLAALPGLFSWVAAQVASWRATTTPQVVTPAGNKIVTAEEPAKKPSILGRISLPKGGLLERLLNR